MADTRRQTSPASIVRIAAWGLFAFAVAGPERLFWQSLAVAAFLVLMSMSYEMLATRLGSPVSEQGEGKG